MEEETGRTRITKDFNTLMRQASGTVDVYLRDGIEIIDRVLGEGYAKANPELLSAFIVSCAKDFNGAANSMVIGEALYAVAEAIEGERR